MSHCSPIGLFKKSASPSILSEREPTGCTREKTAESLFPFLITQAFASRIDWQDPKDPLLLQVKPSAKELETVEGFSHDPLQESQCQRYPGILQKYQGRVILQLTGACPIHCRYCFRRHHKNDTLPKTLADWHDSLTGLASDTTLREVILSGGDPLMVEEERLLAFCDRLSRIPHLRRLRIHSRVPVADPARISSRLLKGLRNNRLVVTLVTHMNHFREMDATVQTTFEAIVDAGIPLFNQSVLLKGINDSAEILSTLSETLLQARATPYYLHLLDPVAGAAHFRVEETRAKQLIEQIRTMLPGLGVPLLVREIPKSLCKRPL